MDNTAHKISDDTDRNHNDDNVKLNWKKIALIGFIPLLLIFIGFFVVVNYIGGDDYSAAVDWFDENLGMGGFFLYVYVVDTLFLSLSQVLVFPIAGWLIRFIVVPVIGTASALGGVTSYAIGLLLHKIPLVKKYTDRAAVKWGAYIRKYGIAFVLLAGILPLPFSTICVLAGALKMDARRVLPATCIRYIRAALYFALFRAGLLII